MKKWEEYFQSREVFLAWVAGFFDGEGSVVVTASKANASAGRPYSLRLICTIAQINCFPLDLIFEEFGGSIVITKLDQEWRQTKRRIPTWNILGHKAVIFLKAIAPYCIQKRDEVELASTWVRKYEPGFNKGGKRLLLTDEEYNARMLIRDGLREIRAKKKTEGMIGGIVPKSKGNPGNLRKVRTEISVVSANI